MAQEAIALDPEYATAYLLVGWLYLDKVWFGMTKTPSESIAKAEEMVQKAISIHGVTEEENALLSCVFLLRKDFDKAISTWNEVLKRSSDYIFACMGLTAAYWFTGSEDQAKQAAQNVLRIYPEFSIGYWEKRSTIKDKALREQLFDV